MKPYLFVISLVLFFSFSINAQANKKVNKKVTTTQQKVPKQKVGQIGLELDSLPPWAKDPGRNTPQTKGVQSNTNGSTLPFKGTDEELQTIQSRRQRNGTNNVVDHKADDQKIQTRGNRNTNQNHGTRKVNRQKKGGGQNVVMSGGSTMIKKGGKQNRNGKNLKQGNVRNTTKRKRKNN